MTTPHDRISIPDDEIGTDGDSCEYIDRALCAEQDLTEIRTGIYDFVEWLREPDRGPVIFRSEVVERLMTILGP